MNCGVEVREGREQLLRVELRLLARLGDQRLRRLVERCAAAAGQILDLEFEAAGGAEAGDRRRIEAEREGVRDLRAASARTAATMRRGALVGRRARPTASGWRIRPPSSTARRWSGS